MELTQVSILLTCVPPRRGHPELEEVLGGVVQSNRRLSGSEALH